MRPPVAAAVSFTAETTPSFQIESASPNARRDAGDRSPRDAARLQRRQPGGGIARIIVDGGAHLAAFTAVAVAFTSTDRPIAP